MLGPEIIDELATVRDWLRYAVSRFSAAGLSYGHGTDNAADEAFWLLTYRGSSATQTPTAGRDPHCLALDVSLLHDLLEKVLGIEVREDTIAFTQDDAAAVDFVARQEYQVVFLLNPTRVEQIVQPATVGKRMPRKSTYFYPKLLTGIVMHKEVGDADYSG